MSFVYRQKQNLMFAHNIITSMMDEHVEEHKINFIQSIFNFASGEEIDMVLQDCEGDETLALFKMSSSIYLENIRQTIKERQMKIYLSCLISDEQKEIAAKYKNEETINSPPPILTEPLDYSSSSSTSSLSTSTTVSIFQITNEDNVKIAEKHPPEYDNHHLFRNVRPNEPQKKGKWSEEEDVLFAKRIEEFGHSGPWGEFSLVIPGRNGYQCRDHYKALVNRSIKARKLDAIEFSGKISMKRGNTRDDDENYISVRRESKRMRR